MRPKRKNNRLPQAKWNNRCAVIIVCYNNQEYAVKCLEALRQQTVSPSQIILVDTGSEDRAYLEGLREQVQVILAEPDCGFCAGNNLGYLAVNPETDAVLLLNPDAFLFPDFIENGLHHLLTHPEVGAVTGLTLGYDFSQQLPSGRIDTTGIFSTWYGKWYDRGQGIPYISRQFTNPHPVPAICGAVFFCRKRALDSVLIGRDIFDRSFYMYKEDIDLSLRLKKKKWKLQFLPDLKAYHCRGWNNNRKKMPRKYRLCSARNDLRVNWKRKHFPGCLYSLLKLTAVKVFNC